VAHSEFRTTYCTLRTAQHDSIIIILNHAGSQAIGQISGTRKPTMLPWLRKHPPCLLASSLASCPHGTCHMDCNTFFRMHDWSRHSTGTTIVQKNPNTKGPSMPAAMPLSGQEAKRKAHKMAGSVAGRQNFNLAIHPAGSNIGQLGSGLLRRWWRVPVTSMWLRPTRTSTE
jgi:hypothetical protein